MRCATAQGIGSLHHLSMEALNGPLALNLVHVPYLSGSIAQAVRHQDVVQRYTILGIDPVGSTPEEYAAQNRTDFVKYAKVVKAAGLKAE